MKTYLFILLSFFTVRLFAQDTYKLRTQPDLVIENVRFSSSGDTLSGILVKPKEVLAAVVLVHGSGKEKRMTEMAKRLAGNGIAVLTYDKRGTGESGGVYMGPEVGTNNVDPSNLNLLALDAGAAINALWVHLHNPKVPVGLLGFSQAGWVIPMAAKGNNRVDFMVLFSGPVVTTLEQLRFQFYTNSDPDFWNTHTEADARHHIQTDQDRYQFTGTDPRDALGKLSIRGLWLFGGKDVQAPAGLSIEHLSTLKGQGKLYDYRLFPELGHNTALQGPDGPVEAAIRWIRSNFPF